MKASKLLYSLAICFIVAVLGSIVTIPSLQIWYRTLNKPFFTPPDIVVGVVWTILYVLMAVSLGLVLSSKKKKRVAVQFFLTQLFLNFLWSLVFFGLHLTIGGLLMNILLFIAIFQTMHLFRAISKQASALLIPYLVWVSFAAILNCSIVFMNF